MPRARGNHEPVATLVGRLLLAVRRERHTTQTLAKHLDLSTRQVNRYLEQLVVAGWQLERKGTPTSGDYWIRLVAPKTLGPRS